MDCITISTFRSLEQQAIRQHKERKIRESAYKGFSITQENPQIEIETNNIEKNNFSNRKINYYA